MLSSRHAGRMCPALQAMRAACKDFHRPAVLAYGATHYTATQSCHLLCHLLCCTPPLESRTCAALAPTPHPRARPDRCTQHAPWHAPWPQPQNSLPPTNLPVSCPAPFHTGPPSTGSPKGMSVEGSHLCAHTITPLSFLAILQQGGWNL